MSELLAKDMTELQPIDSIGRIFEFLADLGVEFIANSADPVPDICRGSLQSRTFAESIIPKLIFKHGLSTSRIYAFTEWLQLVLHQTPAFEPPPLSPFDIGPRRKGAEWSDQELVPRRRRPNQLDIDVFDGEPSALKLRRRRFEFDEELDGDEDSIVKLRRRNLRQRKATSAEVSSGDVDPATGITYEEIPMAFRAGKPPRNGNLEIAGEYAEPGMGLTKVGSHKKNPLWGGLAAPLALGLGAGVAGTFFGGQGNLAGLPMPLISPRGLGIGLADRRGFPSPQVGITSQPLGTAATALSDSIILRNGARGSSALSQDVLKLGANPGASALDPNRPIPADPRLGHVTLVSSPVRVSGKDSSQTGVDAVFQMKDLAKGSRPLTFDDLKVLQQTLPTGAKALYPSLHPNDLGPSAVNLPISPEVINALLYQQGEEPSPGLADKIASLSWPTPVMSALKTDLTQPGRQAQWSSNAAPMSSGSSQRWSRGFGGPSVLRNLGLPIYLSSGANQPHPLATAITARQDLRMVPVPSIPANSFAQMRQQAFPYFHSISSRPSASLLPRIYPQASSQSGHTAIPRFAVPQAKSTSTGASHGAPSFARLGGSPIGTGGSPNHPRLPSIPMRASAVTPPSPARSGPLTPTTGRGAITPKTAHSPTISMPHSPVNAVPANHQSLALPPKMPAPKLPGHPPASPHLDLHVDLPHAPHLDLSDHHEVPKAKVVHTSISKPAMPLKKAEPHDDHAMAVQASKGNMGSAAESHSKSEESASQTGGGKAKDQDVTLLATEVWSLLKRRLQFESERAGHR